MSESPMPKMRADVGIVFSSSEEKNGLFDLLPKAEETIGNGLKYSTTEYKNLTFAAVETGRDKDNVIKACAALNEIFHPARIINAGFAHSLSETLQRNSIFIPDRIISSEKADKAIDFRSRTLKAPKKESEKEEEFFQFFKGFQFDNLKNYPQWGTILSQSEIPVNQEKKQKLQQETGASCCDQISWHVAEYFIKIGKPFLPIRVIISNIDDEFKSETDKMSTATSGANLFGMMIGTLMKKPKSILDFCGSKTDRIVAADKLGKIILALLQENE